jgi:putative phage-type endonuclease
MDEAATPIPHTLIKDAMAYTIIRPADREAWLAQREKGIGSSEVGTILGVNPFETSYQLWMRKKGMTPPIEENEAMRAGHILEGAVARYFEEETGRQVIKASEGDWIAVDKDREFLRVSPDRTYWLSEKRSRSNKGILECKTTQLDIEEDNIPKHWFCQLQYQLGVMGYMQGTIAWLTRGRKFGYVDIQFDADFYAFMISKLEAFWTDSIIGGIEPPVRTIEDIQLKFPTSIDKAVEVSDKIMDSIMELRMIKPQLDELAKQKKELEDAIKAYMADADALCLQGTRDTNPVVVATWRSAKDSQKFNEKAFAEEHPELHARYMRSVSGTRRFLIK